MVFLEQAQVVIRAVHKEFVARKRVKDRVDADPGERVNQAISCNCADLNEAYFFWISMKAVGFGIHCNPGCRAKLGEERGKRLFRINHSGNIRIRGARCKKILQFREKKRAAPVGSAARRRRDWQSIKS